MKDNVDESDSDKAKWPTIDDEDDDIAMCNCVTEEDGKCRKRG